MKKRILALLLIATMIFSAIPASAVETRTEGMPTFVVKTVEAAARETVDVTIKVKNNPGIASIKLETTFDANLTLNSVTYNNAIGGMFMQPQELTSPVILNWFNGAANSNGDWVFATLSFTVADTAAAGTYPITITYEADNVYNIDEINLDFAIQNGGVKVVCPHTNKTEVPAKSADCVNPGNNQYYTCDACGQAFKADGTETTVKAETIAALGHDYADATCTVPKTCKACGATEGEALGHSFTNYVSNNDATCTADGTKTAKCDRCDATDTKTDVGSAKGHNYADATCTAPKTCKVCGATEGEALGHSYATDWSKGEDGHWHACSVCGDKKDFAAHDFGTEGDKCVICEYKRAHVHRLTLVPAVEATCTTGGNKAYYTCSGCEDWFEDSTGNVKIEDHSSVVVAALGHDYADATCTTPKTCKVCGVTEGEKLGHSFTNYVSDNNATCTADGTKTAKCDRCDATDTVIDAGSAKGHDYADATCTAPKTCKACGVTEGEALGHEFETEWSKGDASGHWHACTRCDGHDTPVAHIPGPEATEDDPQLCTVCGYVIQPALGHTHRTTKVEGYAATCTEDGQKTYYVCEGCGKWFEDATANVEITNHDNVILAPSHDWQDATCTAPKTCQVCGATEGEANGHAASDWNTDETSHWKVCTVCNAVIDGSEADHADGNEDGKCDACGYVLVQSYAIIEGMDGKWTVNSGNTLTFRADGEFSQFTGVEVDGVLVDPSNYTAVSGSTVVTLKAEYLKTLTIGKHKLTVVFRNGTAGTNFEIKAASEKAADPDMPQTGDNYPFLLWTAMLFASAVGIAALVIGSKKKQHDGKYVK